MAVPWWNECTNRKAPRCDWSYGLTGSSIEIQGGPLASVRAAITTARIRVCMATSRYGLPVGCRPGQGGLGLREPVHRAVPREHVQLAPRILAERVHAAKAHIEGPILLGRRSPACIREAAQPGSAQVGVEKLTGEGRRLGAAIHEAADDGAVVVRVIVFHRGENQPRAAAGPAAVAMGPLHDVPSVVQSRAACRLDVHLFVQV